MNTSKTILELLVGVLKFVFKLSHVLTLLLVLALVALANAQNISHQKKLTEITIDPNAHPAKYITRNKNLKGVIIRRPPEDYIFRGDTLYVTTPDLQFITSQYIFEFVTKPQDKNLIEMLVRSEIRSVSQRKQITYEIAEDWDGNTIKTNYLQIGFDPAYVFEAANKK